VGLGYGTLEIRCNNVYVMPEATRFARKEMNVLADAAEVRIVVLGD